MTARIIVFDVNETLLDVRALDMTAAGRGLSLSSEDRDRILTGMRSLPAHADGHEAQQLSHAGLADTFERVGRGWRHAGRMRGRVRSAPGKVLYPLAPRPDIVGPDLRAVAEQIIAVDRPRT